MNGMVQKISLKCSSLLFAKREKSTIGKMFASSKKMNFIAMNWIEVSVLVLIGAINVSSQTRLMKRIKFLLVNLKENKNAKVSKGVVQVET